MGRGIGGREVLREVLRERKVERRGVRPPVGRERQSSMRDAPEEEAVWAEEGWKVAISREGMLVTKASKNEVCFVLWYRGGVGQWGNAELLAGVGDESPSRGEN